MNQKEEILKQKQRLEQMTKEEKDLFFTKYAEEIIKLANFNEYNPLKKINIFYNTQDNCVEIKAIKDNITKDEDIFYVNGAGLYGMESEYTGDSEEYNKIIRSCDIIAEEIRKIGNILYKKRNKNRCFYGITSTIRE